MTRSLFLIILYLILKGMNPKEAVDLVTSKRESQVDFPNFVEYLEKLQKWHEEGRIEKMPSE